MDKEDRQMGMKILCRSEKWAQGILYVSLCLYLGVVCVTTPELPAEMTAGQWAEWADWIYVALAGMWIALLIHVMFGIGYEGQDMVFGGFSVAASWALMTMGVVQAVWGLCQLYGTVASGHSHYAMTGAFFNPGPYGGYLAMVLPLCLNRYMQWWYNSFKGYDYGFHNWKWAGAAGVLILLVLPATMSRAAWLAAAVGCVLVWWQRDGSWRYCRRYRVLVWRRWRGRCIALITAVVLVVAAAATGMFLLKPDSALGRLFLWKMTCRAIAAHPWTGHPDSFAAAYGEAQSSYFAAGDYAGWEERVAGSPEYAFNEYLELAATWGIPALLVVLCVLGVCLYTAWRRGRYGIMGALVSLMVFAFFSYPMHLPGFMVAAVVLLAACFWGPLVCLVLPFITGIWVMFADCDYIGWEAESQYGRRWAEARILYRMKADKAALPEYYDLSSHCLMMKKGAFLFEYGHIQHRLGGDFGSNLTLEEARRYTCDPMVLNIMGKNYQMMEEYDRAEECFIQAIHLLPNRIYPYYLLAKLYALPEYRHPDKLEEMKRVVLTKEPKVMSTAIRQMREEVKQLK